MQQMYLSLELPGGNSITSYSDSPKLPGPPKAQSVSYPRVLLKNLQEEARFLERFYRVRLVPLHPPSQHDILTSKMLPRLLGSTIKDRGVRGLGGGRELLNFKVQ